MNLHRITLLFLCVALSACVAEVGNPLHPFTGGTDSPLIYGADDRVEYYQLTDSGLIAAADATAGLFSSADVVLDGAGYLVDISTSFGDYHNLCSTEPYRDQPSSAFCSGFMVGTDLIATAGHCVDETSCANTTFVFGFRMIDATTVRSQVALDDVYYCQEIVARQQTSTEDFAVVRVDRPISGRTAMTLRRSGTVAAGTPLVMLGHPSGIPLKIAGGAQVQANGHGSYFEANVDAYGGNSGSPVLNGSDLSVEGILVRGNTDFVRIGKGRNRCYVSNVCDDSGCPGWEDVTRTSLFEAYAPETACGADADCDDLDPCNGAETCVDQTCRSGQAVDCTDGAGLCTDDACVPLGGTTWECSNTTVTCDDEDPCTTDGCNPATGCIATPIDCGTGFICSDGACIPEPVCAAKKEPCATDINCCSGRCDQRKGTCR